MIEQVRSFNRLVTQSVGALQDHYLSRSLPLGEARVLWEIGPDGCDVRTLRTRLDLDSGYLSRLLRSLEAAGLVRVRPSADDRRVRTASLTAHARPFDPAHPQPVHGTHRGRQDNASCPNPP